MIVSFQFTCDSLIIAPTCAAIFSNLVYVTVVEDSVSNLKRNSVYFSVKALLALKGLPID